MRIRYLLIIAIVCAFAGMVGLRWNQIRLSHLKKEVVRQDQAAGDVTGALNALKQFVVQHMNTSTVIELPASYQRAVDKATQAVNDQNEQLLHEAQAACDKPGIGSVAQAQCVRAFLEARRQPGDNPLPPQLPDKNRYKYAFVAPVWSPDLAGLGLLGAGIFSLLALVAYIKSLTTRQK